ncbi:unnamed protein product [Caenorhabditis angaria]|uniref:UDENN domain-containing protein n=1 Tax=Caenorhabditis angaria TaxID=860376 RepID=A0A9P1IN44_9PELO|nr:unnamed protein product [Caenorhabditis angaria]
MEREVEPEPEPWDRFKDWLHSICVVTFDLELGQALEVIYPGDAILSNVEKINICYLAFPDSNSSNAQDANFHFRIRRILGDVRPCRKQLIEKSPSSFPFDPHYLYGFVHFRQCKDPKIHRGYFQKSIVLMTTLPLFSLFYSVTARIAEHFFENGEAAIEAACHHIDTWLQPSVGKTLELPLLGSIITCRIPAASDLPYDFRMDGYVELSDHTANNKLFRPDFATPILSQIYHLQLIWELVLLGEPLLIIAPTPAISASLVQSIVALISPLRVVNDFRPYFTIHDSEFKEYSSKSRNPPRVILGVTNPFFTKALDHWPHILKIAENTGEKDESHKPRKNWSSSRTLDIPPGLYTQYKPFLSRDKSLAKKLLKTTQESQKISILQRHFLELTQSFMIPMERYLSSLMPLKKEMTPFKGIPSSRPFSMDDFLSSLDTIGGPSLTCGTKGDWSGLYRKFISCANFGGWLSMRARDVSTQLKTHYVEALCSADFCSQTLSTKHNVEIVDLVLRIRERIIELGSTESSENRKKLVRQIVKILSNVDEDLKQLLMSNCSLREILV